jgi:hypothetical protein
VERVGRCSDVTTVGTSSHRLKFRLPLDGFSVWPVPGLHIAQWHRRRSAAFASAPGWSVGCSPGADHLPRPNRDPDLRLGSQSSGVGGLPPGGYHRASEPRTLSVKCALPWTETVLDFGDPLTRRDWLRRLQASAEGRARKAQMRFTLPPEFAATLYDRQLGRCAVSGIEFNLQRFADALVKHPFAPSIDRKLSSGGYTEDNVRLVCVAVNFGMGQWGEEVYMTIARAAVAREAKDRVDPDPAGDADWYARQRERIAAAEMLRDRLPETEKAKLRRHIASLRRALSLGPAGLRAAAQKAISHRQTRQSEL